MNGYLSVTLLMSMMVLSTCNIPDNCDFYYKASSSNDYSCMKCKDKFYYDFTTNTCNSCPYSDSCVIYEKTIYSNSQNSCQTGFFYDTDLSICLSCPDNCSLCIYKNSFPICLSCKDSNMLLTNNTCVCKDGYFLDSTSNQCVSCRKKYGKGCSLCTLTTCQQCVSECLNIGCSCSNSSLSTACINYSTMNFSLSQATSKLSDNCYCYNSDNNCAIDCPSIYKDVTYSESIVACNSTDYYYSQNTINSYFAPLSSGLISTKAKLCNYIYSNCADCDILKGCTKCLTGYSLHPFYSYCYPTESSCFYPYWNNNKDCLECNGKSCSKCIYSFEGSEEYNCQQGLLLFFKSCSIQNCSKCITSSTCGACSTGYTLSNYSQSCIPCSVFNTNCAVCSGSKCTRCNDGYYLTAQNKCQQCLSNSCLTCESSSPTNCSSCQSGFVLVNGKCYACSEVVSSKCNSCSIVDCKQCISTTSLGFNGLCVKCNNIQMQCSSCNPQIYTTPSNTQLLTCMSCLSGSYFDSSVGNCVDCYFSFSNCSTCTANTCLSCNQYFYMDSNGECVSSTSSPLSLGLIMIIVATSCCLMFVSCRLIKGCLNKHRESIATYEIRRNDLNLGANSIQLPIKDFIHLKACCFCKADLNNIGFANNPDTIERQLKQVICFFELTCNGFICNNCKHQFEDDLSNGKYHRCCQCYNIITGLKENINDAELYSVEEGNKDENELNIPQQDDICCICRRIKPMAVIPCHSKPHHLLHTKCLNELFLSETQTCPICKTQLDLPLLNVSEQYQEVSNNRASEDQRSEVRNNDVNVNVNVNSNVNIQQNQNQNQVPNEQGTVQLSSQHQINLNQDIIVPRISPSTRPINLNNNHIDHNSEVVQLHTIQIEEAKEANPREEVKEEERNN